MLSGMGWAKKLMVMALSSFLAIGCSSGGGGESGGGSVEPEARMLQLPELPAADLNGARLSVVATTSIIGDVVARVGGDNIEFTTLMGAGQDPHSYEPGAQALTAVAGADIIFVNGWDLEEALVGDLGEIGENVPLVAVSAGIEPLALGEGAHIHDEEQAEAERGGHSGADPHVWFDIDNVKQWAQNIAVVLSGLDPDHSNSYAERAAAYIADLDALDVEVKAKLSLIPEEKRVLITNHDSLRYFAQAYNFTILGTVIPSFSTLSEPSASDLASLIAEMEAHDVCSIFTETSVSDMLAQTAAAELENCDSVQVLPLYTGSLGPAGSGADSYVGMFLTNVDTIMMGTP